MIEIGTRKIILYPEVLAVLERFTQKKANDLESGGIVLGKMIGEVIHVDRLSLPTALDKASRHSFERAKLSGQIIIDYEFQLSNGTITYLGEWHTHPENLPNPSDTDVRMIREQFHSNRIRTEFLLLLIKGLEDLYVGVWENNQLAHKRYPGS